MSAQPVLSRRSLLRHTAQATALAAGLSVYAPLFADAGSRRFKIGACDWSIGKRSNPAAFEVAKQIGLDGVQIDMGSAADSMKLRRADVQEAYRQAAKKTGLEIASLAMGELNNVPLKSDPRAAGWLADSVEVCRAMGLKVVLVACFGRGDLDMRATAEIDHYVKVLKDVAPQAEKHGVTLGLENYLSAEDNRTILDRVGSSAVKVYYDVGNSTDKGRDVVKEIRALGKLICEFHAKDAGHMLGKGRVDFREVRKAMDSFDYHGWIHIEAAAPHGLIPDYTAHRKFLREVFPG